MARAAPVALLALLGVLAVRAAVAAPLTIDVNVGDRALQLVVGENDDIVQTVASFCDANGIPAENVGRLVAAVEEEARKQAPRQPATSMLLSVNGVDRRLEYFEGQVPEEVVRRFLLDGGLTGAEAEFESWVRDLSLNIRRALAPPEAPKSRVILSVVVKTERGAVPLDVLEGDTATDAAVRFVRAQRVSEEHVPVLVRTIMAKAEAENAKAAAAAAPKEQPLFVMDLYVGSTPWQLPIYANRDLVSVTEGFCAEAGINSDDECTKVYQLIQQRAAQEQRRLQAMLEPEVKTLSFVLGNTNQALDLEFPVGADSAELASGFCREHWDMLSVELSVVQAADVTMDDCVSLLSEMVRKQSA